MPRLGSSSATRVFCDGDLGNACNPFADDEDERLISAAPEDDVGISWASADTSAIAGEVASTSAAAADDCEGEADSRLSQDSETSSASTFSSCRGCCAAESAASAASESGFRRQPHSYVSNRQAVCLSGNGVFVWIVGLSLTALATRTEQRIAEVCFRFSGAALIWGYTVWDLDALADMILWGRESTDSFIPYRRPTIYLAILSSAVTCIPIGTNSRGRVLFPGFFDASVVFIGLGVPLSLYIHLRKLGTDGLHIMRPFGIYACFVFPAFIALSTCWSFCFEDATGRVSKHMLSVFSVVVHILEMLMVYILGKAYRICLQPLVDDGSDMDWPLGHAKLIFDFLLGCTFILASTCWLASLSRYALQNPGIWRPLLDSVIVHLLMGISMRTLWLNKFLFEVSGWLVFCFRLASRRRELADDDPTSTEAPSEAQRIFLPNLGTRILLSCKHSLGWRWQGGFILLGVRLMLMNDPTAAAFYQQSSSTMMFLLLAAWTGKALEDLVVFMAARCNLSPRWPTVLAWAGGNRVRAKYSWHMKFHQPLALAPHALAINLAKLDLSMSTCMLAIFIGMPVFEGCERAAGKNLFSFHGLLTERVHHHC